MNPGDDQAVLHEMDGRVAVLWLNRPQQRNAMDLAMRAEFARRVDALLGDDAVAALVLAGRGEHFCTGGDLGSMPTEPLDAEQGRRRMASMAPTVERILRAEKPVVAAVDGCAFGGGFGIALLADYVVATPRARLCASFGQVGLVPDMGSLFTLVRSVGLHRARQLLFSGREISGTQAHDWGIVAELAEPGDLVGRAKAVAAQLCGGSGLAFALTKQGLAVAEAGDLQTALAFEALAQGVAMSGRQHREAVAALRARAAARTRGNDGQA